MFANRAARGTVLALSASPLLLVCELAPAQSAPASTPAYPARTWAIYDRADTRFTDAHFFKPAETGGAPDLFFTLAPLILQEKRKPVEGSTDEKRFGRLGKPEAELVLDTARPTVYAEADTVLVGGRSHARIAYTWFYATGRLSGNGVAAQGVRMILNSSGSPVIWEVLADTSGLRLFYVADSLERALSPGAQPLPGRRFAVERGTNETPGVVVARVIDDGPVPMGPTLYLARGTRDVSTLICRCMPAQATNLLVTTTYELFRPGGVSPALLLYEARSRGPQAGGFSTQPIETLLRLPKEW